MSFHVYLVSPSHSIKNQNPNWLVSHVLCETTASFCKEQLLVHCDILPRHVTRQFCVEIAQIRGKLYFIIFPPLCSETCDRCSLV